MPFNPGLIPINLLVDAGIEQGFNAMEDLRDSVFTPLLAADSFVDAAFTAEEHEAFHAQFVSNGTSDTSSLERPHVSMLTPVYEDSLAVNSSVVGGILNFLAFDVYLANLVPDGIDGIYAVIKNNCDDPSHTYELTGVRAVYLGPEDLHEKEFDDKEEVVTFAMYQDPARAANTPGHCTYTIHLYPSQKFVSRYKTKIPVIFTSIVAVVFLVMTAAFFIYDRSVNRRNSKVEGAAVRSNALVASLFPTNVREKLYEQAEEEEKMASVTKTQAKLNQFLNTASPTGTNLNEDGAFAGKPIAELL